MTCRWSVEDLSLIPPVMDEPVLGGAKVEAEPSRLKALETATRQKAEMHEHLTFVSKVSVSAEALRSLVISSSLSASRPHRPNL